VRTGPGGHRLGEPGRAQGRRQRARHGRAPTDRRRRLHRLVPRL